MPKKRFTDEQIALALRLAEAGTATREPEPLCRQQFRRLAWPCPSQWISTVLIQGEGQKGTRRSYSRDMTRSSAAMERTWKTPYARSRPIVVTTWCIGRLVRLGSAARSLRGNV
jgi:hypothetical protein